MKVLLSLMLLALGWGSLCQAASDEQSWTVHEAETIHKTLSLAGEPNRLVIENVFGYVHVTGTRGSGVQVTAHKRISAETASDLNRAKSEVKITMTEQPGEVRVEYDAPWNCKNECRGCCDQGRRFYEVEYDIDVEAPQNARLVVATVNNGDIRLDHIGGDFSVSNVNGGIVANEMAGSGEIRTVNGPITAHFLKNPTGPSSFKTVNGELEIYLQPSLSADVSFKTLNGEIFTDFDVAPRAIAASVERRNGKYIYRSNRAATGRIGSGGPELDFETLNGSIRLHRQ